MLTRWVNAVTYLAEYLDVLGEFISSGEVTSGSACFGELKKHGGMIVSTLEKLEPKQIPLAHSINGIMHNLSHYMEYGSLEDDDFDSDVNLSLEDLTSSERAACVSSFQEASATKLNSLWENHPARHFYEQVRIFDPKQLPLISIDQQMYEYLFGETDISGCLWHLRIADLPEEINLTEWWKAQSSNLPTLSKIDIPFIWVPVTSREVESQYANILSHDRQVLSEESVRTLFTLKWNGDLTK